MVKHILAAAIAAATFAVPAYAQDMNTDQNAPATAPDGTRAFGIDPYVAVMGGWEQFDSEVARVVG